MFSFFSNNFSILLPMILGTDYNPLIGAIAYSKPINPPDCILDNWVSENFIITDEPFAKSLQIFETCILVNNNLCGKLVSSLELPMKFDERFKVTSILFLLQISTN